MKPILAIYGIQDRFAHPYPGYTHDHNLTLLENGKISHYLHLERFTRRKNDNQLALHVEEIIDQQIQLKNEFQLVSVNSFVGNSFISKTGRLRIEPNLIPAITNNPQPATGWFQQLPWEGTAPESWIVPHELAHIFSCLPFFGEFKENSLFIHFDGGASMGNFSAFHFRDNDLKILECHWELSHLSKIYNDNALSFALMKAAPGEHCSVPGKLMGYAAMGQASVEMEKWLVENNFFKDIWDDHLPFYRAANKWGWNGHLDNNNDPFLQNVAASLQSIFQKEIVHKIRTLAELTKADYLYYTGGCALNISANSKIVSTSCFKDVFIPPACNDSGLSTGAAAFLNWHQNNSIEKHGPYLNGLQVDTAIEYLPSTIVEIARQLMAGKIIGICNGNGEAGPRALGNRSIIARADDKDIAQKVSMGCKQREWFRPIAPVMLERNAKLVTGSDSLHHLSRYMLLDFDILEKYLPPLAGVVHTNGTARIQVVFDRSDNPFLYDLLEYMHQQFGALALINTSFNQHGGPIVQTPKDAGKAAVEMHLDGIVLNGKYQAL